jgi:hypothetical protein
MKRLSSFGFVPLAQAQTSQEPADKRARPSHSDIDPSGAAVHSVQPQHNWSKIFAALTRGYTVQKPLSIDPAYAPECSVTVILG